jgi:hypothetical protein
MARKSSRRTHLSTGMKRRIATKGETMSVMQRITVMMMTLMLTQSPLPR